MISGADRGDTQVGSTCSGGSFIPDDCVVCLTEHKAIVLLPCRFVMLSYNSYIIFSLLIVTFLCFRQQAFMCLQRLLDLY